MKVLSLISILIPFIFFISEFGDTEFDADESVANVLRDLGDTSPNLVKIEGELVSAEIGRDIIFSGFSKGKGKASKQQSKHFVCTSCHNVEKEDPDLSVSDPEARLHYTNEKGLPFLQGTTLYGAVNRTSFYNGDYKLKYGDLVDEARNNIRKSIQLCATECAQGRPLEDWEIESILAFLWTIDLKMGDLNFSDSERSVIEAAKQSGTNQAAAVELIKSKFLDGSPADFSTPPEDRKAGYPVSPGNPHNGQLIYENSCLYCHENQRYSFFHLDDSKLTMKWLNKKAEKYSRQSIYQVVRYGVDSHTGKKSYMPKYPLQKMSDQQVEDLKAYIKEAAES